MLDTILDATEVAPTTQAALYELYSQRKDFENLAKLCQIPNLTPELDVKLGKLGNAKVRKAWLCRAGRDEAAIAKMLRSEKRVSVLADLAQLELPDGMHLQILAANASAKTAFAVAGNPAAPSAARAEAIRAIGRAGTVTQVQWQSLLRLAQDEDVQALLLETATTIPTLELAVSANAVSEAGVANVATVLTAQAAQLSAELTRHGMAWSHWKLTEQLTRWMRVATVVVSADWCPGSLRDTLLTTGEGITTVAQTTRVAASLNHHFEQLRRQHELASGTIDGSLEQFITRAGTVTTLDEVHTLVGEVREMPAPRKAPVLEALLVNEALDVEAQLIALRHLDVPARRRVASGARGSAYPVTTKAALALLNCLTPQQPETISLTIEHLGLADGLQYSVVAGLIQSQRLTDDQLLGLPAQVVAMVLHRQLLSQVDRAQLGALLDRQLAGQPVTVLQQFQQLAPSYLGSIRTLLVACEAAGA